MVDEGVSLRAPENMLVIESVSEPNV